MVRDTLDKQKTICFRFESLVGGQPLCIKAFSMVQNGQCHLHFELNLIAPVKKDSLYVWQQWNCFLCSKKPVMEDVYVSSWQHVQRILWKGISCLRCEDPHFGVILGLTVFIINALCSPFLCFWFQMTFFRLRCSQPEQLLSLFAETHLPLETGHGSATSTMISALV